MSNQVQAPVAEAPKQLQIRQHNALTLAKYDYSEIQLDFLFFLLSKLRADSKDLTYLLHVSELAKLTGNNYNTKYLYDATKEMGSRVFEVTLHEIKRQVWMFQSVDYHEGKATIEVTLSEKILPLLFDLKGNFTSYELQAVLKLSSKYAKRIYQICSMWKDKPQTQNFDLYEFKQMLGMIDKDGNESYARFGTFKQQVLDRSIRQINQLTDLHIALKLEKTGKAYTGFAFTIENKAYNLQLDFGNSHKLPSPAPAGISHQQMESAERFLDEMGVFQEKIRHQILSSPAHLKNLFKFAHQVRTGEVKVKSNAGGMLLTILGLVDASKKAPKKE
ncbi:replication initiation protein [Hymenobacter guriensis]|uniref:Replication initiation protein n=1 Tax=Hymenobacter guriensis TaxID=2793065 RepID=A0ABS0L859_9BACT|nr:replication initiation protein [Hymenobacter guriensis]MBG8556297.1 replication initiation protein [Hymenobacter guriensis]